MKKLREQIGLGHDAVDSYYDIAHALHTSEQLNNEEVINFRMAQGIASNASSATLMLKRSGNLDNSLEERLQKRRALIEHFNEQYASDTACYIYYQIGWVYLAMKSPEASYVDEFARRHLGMSPQLLEIRLPENYPSRAIYACFKASQELAPVSTTLSRYFYKCYRALLLGYLKQNHQAILRDVQDASDLNWELFRTLSPEIQLEFAHKLYRVHYSTGESFVWDGENNNDVFILLEGQLEAITPEKASNSIIQPGQVLANSPG